MRIDEKPKAQARRGAGLGWRVLIVVLAVGWRWAPVDAGEVRRVIVLGIDGMDYALTRKWMSEGHLPHLAALAKGGCLIPLHPSMPPLSPVAWSNFITGRNPGGHGVYDFLHRDPARAGKDLLPTDAVSRTLTPPHPPLAPPRHELHLAGETRAEGVAQRAGAVATPGTARNSNHHLQDPRQFPSRWGRPRAGGDGNP